MGSLICSARVPADDAPREQIHEQGQVGEGAGSQRNVRDVSDPDSIDALGRRRGGQEVRTVAELMPTVGCFGDEGFGLNGPQTLDFQEFCNTIDTAGLTLGAEFHGDPAGAGNAACDARRCRGPAAAARDLSGRGRTRSLAAKHKSRRG